VPPDANKVFQDLFGLAGRLQCLAEDDVIESVIGIIG
jgi:hypothetical protein